MDLLISFSFPPVFQARLPESDVRLGVTRAAESEGTTGHTRVFIRQTGECFQEFINAQLQAAVLFEGS